MIGRRRVAALLGALAAPRIVVAQPSGRTWRIGVLDWSSAKDRVIYDGLVMALRDIGYVEGRAIVIEYRGADGDSQQAQRFANELARSQIDLLIALSTPAAHAAKRATHTIPIVFHMADPLATGLVASLARPGGNLTGVSVALPDIAAKWLELLREVMPGVVRVAFLGAKSDPNAYTQLRRIEGGAARLGITIQPLLVDNAGDFGATVAAAAGGGASVLIVQTILLNHRAAIDALAQRHRLAWIAERRDAAEAGALLSYGANRRAVYRRLATYVDRILRGATPGDLPIEEPTQFDLVLNLRAARTLKIDVPASLLARADEVIE